MRSDRNVARLGVGVSEREKQAEQKQTWDRAAVFRVLPIS